MRVGVIGHGGLLRGFPSLARKYKGFWACLGDLCPDMSRHSETWVSLCNLMLKLRGISHSSSSLGSDSPQSNNRKGDSVRDLMSNTLFFGYLRLLRPTPAPALMRVLHWLLHWLAVEWMSQGTPLAIRPNIMARYKEATASLGCLL